MSQQPLDPVHGRVLEYFPIFGLKMYCNTSSLATLPLLAGIGQLELKWMLQVSTIMMRPTSPMTWGCQRSSVDGDLEELRGRCIVMSSFARDSCCLCSRNVIIKKT